MKLEISVAANAGFACCGHYVAAGERVLRTEHAGSVGMTCLRRQCAGPFLDADAKLDTIALTRAGEYPALHADAEEAADAAHSKAIKERESHAQNAQNREALAAEAAEAVEAAKGSPERLAEARQTHALALALHDEALRLRDLHLSRARTPAFHAACAWLDAVRRA